MTKIPILSGIYADSDPDFRVAFPVNMEPIVETAAALPPPAGPYLVPVYVVYAVVSIGLTIWLARTLSKNGEVFLRDVFADKPDLAARSPSV